MSTTQAAIYANNPPPDYNTGLRDLNKTTLASNEATYLYQLLMATDPSMFVLPFGTVNGYYTLERDVERFEDWTISYGTLGTTQQTRWYVVLIRNLWPNGPRVAARVMFENDDIPYSGDEMRQAMLLSIRSAAQAVQLRTIITVIPRPDHGYF